MHQQRQALIYPGEDGFWVVECPSLPGCISQGQTKEEALENIREAIDLYVESLREDCLAIPDSLHWKHSTPQANAASTHLS
jgi:predicted RNase H-like HicB family nuclease